ncbi:MAG: tetraacyldisaccharide 4'-kinase [Planctomycetota bacterium]
MSGRRRGIGAAAMRSLLACAEPPYAAAAALRNQWYDRNPGAATRVDAAVISVGNLTVGGTGKTPLVKWAARQLRARGVRVAILSRGYGAEAGAKNDEAMELEQALPDVPHLQNPDRVAAARVAIDELDSQALLLDDGFQHRRLARDLDIVLLDATSPFGYGHLLPRGILRESVHGLRRASAVCLTRADAIAPEQRAAIRRRVDALAGGAAWCEVAHQPRTLLASSGAERPFTELAGRRVAAFCGIGNPAAFRRTLEGAGARVVAWRELPDHHNYTAPDIESVAASAEESDAELVVCTHKDLVKVQAEGLAGRPLLAVVVEMAFLTGEAALQRRIEEALAGGADQKTPGA